MDCFLYQGPAEAGPDHRTAGRSLSVQGEEGKTAAEPGSAVMNVAAGLCGAARGVLRATVSCGCGAA